MRATNVREKKQKTGNGDTMALLKLKDIGKIYVSEGNVTVGIRGVNLAFDKGEFVAVTGKSGSGKSTLLNVISGMDSYEEGELFIDGQTTSHYVEENWEEYREKYISFIFQDYNIIESFTVLENVELALFHIEDKEKRRARAIELLTRVGLGDRLSQKGSKLSGGQKQRTVIARALAKDSPIILADEPTGNLDSKTAKEIIELLCEVSKDKLLIVVTHNFEQVQEYATRHVRIYDGAVEFDHTVKNSAAKQPQQEETERIETPKQARKKLQKKTLRNGFSLGWTVFKAKPKLSAFLCLLLIVGGIGIFMITSLCGDAVTKKTEYLFRHIDGRVALTRDAGEPLSDEELQTLVEEYGANSYLRYDGLLDDGYYTYIWVKDTQKSVKVDCVYGEKFGDDIVGRYPEAPNEVFLYLPIYEQPTFGKKSILKSEIMFGNMDLNVVGLSYYYDNNQTAKMLFTNDGFRTATSVLYLDKYFNYGLVNAVCEFTTQAGFDEITGEPIEVLGTADKSYSANKLYLSYDLPADAAYFSDTGYSEWKKSYDTTYADIKWTLRLSLLARYERAGDSYSTGDIEIQKTNILTDKAPQAIEKNPFLEKDYGSIYSSKLYAGIDLINELADAAMQISYSQASLFFDNDEAAIEAAKKLSANGYIAVPSCTQASEDPLQALLNAMERFILLVTWLVTVLFLGLFIYLCTARAVGAFKGELGIMRSMGISASVVRVSMYARMLFALIPAFTIITVSALTVFLTPTLNGYFTYLYAAHYVCIFGGMLLLTAYITRRQIRKLFNVKVKKSLKGGVEE